LFTALYISNKLQRKNTHFPDQVPETKILSIRRHTYYHMCLPHLNFEASTSSDANVADLLIKNLNLIEEEEVAAAFNDDEDDESSPVVKCALVGMHGSLADDDGACCGGFRVR
jgi:hypothetical protein